MKKKTERVFVMLCEDGEVSIMRADEDKADQLRLVLLADKKVKLGKNLWEVQPGRDIKFLGVTDN